MFCKWKKWLCKNFVEVEKTNDFFNTNDNLIYIIIKCIMYNVL